MPNIQKQLDNLNQQVEDLRAENEELSEDLGKIKKQRLGYPLDSASQGVVKDLFRKILKMKNKAILKIGDSFLSGNTYNPGGAAESNMGFWIAGTAKANELTYGDHSENTQINLLHLPGTTGGANQSFLYGYRAPLYTNSGVSITSGGSTLTDGRWDWDTNELAGAYIDAFTSAGAFQETHEISSNTSDTITISGSWGFTDASAVYIVFMPIYLGSADYPWRRGYFGEDIRLGFGTSSGSEVLYIKWGTGSPENSVSANVGSLYLRKDGGAGTTLYVKESGTGNTGWVGK